MAIRIKEEPTAAALAGAGRRGLSRGGGDPIAVLDGVSRSGDCVGCGDEFAEEGLDDLGPMAEEVSRLRQLSARRKSRFLGRLGQDFVFTTQFTTADFTLFPEEAEEEASTLTTQDEPRSFDPTSVTAKPIDRTGGDEQPETGGTFDPGIDRVCPAMARMSGFDPGCAELADYIRLPATEPAFAIRADAREAEIGLSPSALFRSPSILALIDKAFKLAAPQGQNSCENSAFMQFRQAALAAGLDPGPCHAKTGVDILKRELVRQHVRAPCSNFKAATREDTRCTQRDLTVFPRYVLAALDHPVFGEEYWLYYEINTIGEGPRVDTDSPEEAVDAIRNSPVVPTITFHWRPKSAIPVGGGPVEDQLERFFSPAIDFIEDVADVVGDILSDLKGIACAVARKQLVKLEGAAKAGVTLPEADAIEIAGVVELEVEDINQATTTASGELLSRVGNRLVDNMCGGAKPPEASRGSFFDRWGKALLIGGAVVGGGFLLLR